MSYILDALRKSENERRIGALPTLENTPLDTPEKSSRQSWIVILIGALICLNVGTLLVTTVFNQEDSTASLNTVDKAPGDLKKAPPVRQYPEQNELVLNPNNTARSLATATPEKLPKPQSQIAQPVITTTPLPAPDIRSSTPSIAKTASKPTLQPMTVAKQSADKNQNNQAKHSKVLPKDQTSITKPLLAAPTSPLSQPQLAASPPQPQHSKPPADGNHKTTVTGAAITRPKQSVATTTPQQPRSVSKPATDRKTLAELPIRKPKTTVATATPTAPSDQPLHSTTHKSIVQPPPTTQSPKVSIPLLTNMDRDFQRQIPALNINVFVYSEAPEERFVIINMVKYKNGQKLRDGPLLGEIRSDSVVLNYHGRDFRLSRP